MALANITVSVTEPNVTVSSDNVNVSVSSTTTNVVVGDASITSNADVRAALSNVSPILYDSSTGIISFDSNGFVTDNFITINNTTTGVNDTLTLGSNQTLDADSITEGSTQQFFTTTRFNTSFATKTTDDLTQGSTNLYYSNSLVNAYLPSYSGVLTNLTGGLPNLTANVTTTADINGNNILATGTLTTNDSLIIPRGGASNNIIVGGDGVGLEPGYMSNVNIQNLTQIRFNHPGDDAIWIQGDADAYTYNKQIGRSITLQGNTDINLWSDQLHNSGGASNIYLTMHPNATTSGSPAGNGHVGGVLHTAYIYNTGNTATYGTPGIGPSGNVNAWTGREELEIRSVGNIDLNAAGTVATVSSTGIHSTSNITTTANITGNYLLGNGSQLSGVATNAQAQAFIEENGLDGAGNITMTGVATFGNSATQVHTFTGNLNVTGNVEVSGNLNYRNVEDLQVQDTEIIMNANAATDATVSIIANRPVAGSNTVLRWNETDDKWQYSNDGSTFYNLISNADSQAYIQSNGLAMTANLTSNSLISTTGNLQVNPDTVVGGLKGLTFDSSTNRLGLGTTTPSAGIHIVSDDDFDAQLYMEEYKDSFFGPDIRSYKARGTLSSPTAAQAGDRMLEYRPHGYDGTQFLPTIGMMAAVDSTSTVAANVLPTVFSWEGYKDGDVTTSYMSLMKLRGNGDFQIGNLGFSSSNNTPNFSVTHGGVVSAVGNVSSDAFFVGDLDGAVVQDVRNETGSTLSKGKAVYLTGSSTGDNPHVALADADDSAKMPALGIVYSDIANASVGQVVTSGVINVASHGFTEGADLFVSTTAGDLTTTAPTGNSNALQKIGKVVSANHILVQGAFRQNATPNLDANTIFIGNSTNQASTVNLNSLSSSIITDKRLEGDRFSGGNVVVPIEQYIFSSYTYIKFSSANDPHLPNGTKIFIQDTDANNPLANGSINSDNIFYTRKSTTATYYILYLDEALQNISTVSVPTTSPANANVTFGSVLANGPITMSAGVVGLELEIGSNAYTYDQRIRNDLTIGETALRNSKLDLSGDATITNYSGNAALTLVNNINSSTVPTQLLLKQNKNAGTAVGVAGDSLSVIQTQGIPANVTQSNTSVQDAQAFNNGTLTEDSIAFSGGQIFSDGTEVVYSGATDGDVTPLNGRTFFLKYNTGDGGRYELFDDSGFTTGSRRITNGVFRTSGVGQVQTTTTSAGSIKTFANVLTKMTTPTLGSEDAEIDFRLMKAGTETSTLLLKSTEANINVPINSNSNITTSGSFVGDGSALTNVPGGDSFGTITVSGQTNIQASQSNAILDIASSGAITLTTSGNTLTIGGSGSGYGNAEVTDYLASATSVGNVAFTGNLIVESGNTSYSPSSYEGNVTSGTIDRVVFSSDPGFYEGQPILFSGTVNSNLTFLNGNVYYVKGAGVSNSYSLYTDVGLLTGLTSGLGTESPNSLAGTVRNESNQHNEFYGNVDISRGAHLNVHSIKSYVPGGTFSMSGIRASDVGVGNYFLPDTGGTTEGAVLTAHSDGAATFDVGLNITSDSAVDVITVTEARNSSLPPEERFKKARGSTSSPTAVQGGSGADRIHEVEYYGHDGTDYITTFGEHVYVDTSVASVATNIMPLTKEFYCRQDGDVTDTPVESIMKLRPNRSIEFNANGTRGYGTQGNANVQMDGSIYSAATVNALNVSTRQFLSLKNYSNTEILALTGMSAGDVVFNSTDNTIAFYEGSNWKNLTVTGNVT